MPARTRPLGQLDANYRWDPDSFADEAFRGQYDGNNNLIYKGVARPGADPSVAEWQICFLTYDGSDNLLSVTWPQNAQGVASQAYEFIWNNRATYTYS